MSFGVLGFIHGGRFLFDEFAGRAASFHGVFQTLPEFFVRRGVARIENPFLARAVRGSGSAGGSASPSAIESHSSG